MNNCLYNGIQHPEIKKFLEKTDRNNCFNCEYKYPCTNYEEFSPEKIDILIDKMNIERKINDDRIILSRIKSGYYQTATL